MINPRNWRQGIAADWALNAFGAAQSRSPEQRGLRLVEEAIEAAQVVGCDPQQLHRLIDFVYSRPVGDIDREIGGVGLTLLCFAAACKHSADACEDNELQRVLSKPLSHFTERNQLKNEAGFQAKDTK